MSGFLSGLGLVLQGVGAAGAFLGAREQADAVEGQALELTALSERERRFIAEQAEIEAELIERQGGDEAAVLAFNEEVARSNAAWARRAGEVARAQAARRWQAHVEDTVARFAASGAALTGTSNEVIAEQIAEMEQDLFLTDLNAERAALAEEERAYLFSLRRGQTARAARHRAVARRRIGEIEAESAGTAAASRAAQARSAGRSARITGFANLIQDTADLFSLA